MVFGGTNILQHVERNEGEGLHEWSVFINLKHRLHQPCSYIKKKSAIVHFSLASQHYCRKHIGICWYLNIFMMLKNSF